MSLPLPRSTDATWPACLLLLILPGARAFDPAPSTDTVPASPGRAHSASAAEPAALVEAAWWSQVQEKIAELEYAPSSTDAGELEAPNRAHDIRTRFRPAAVEIVPRRSESARGRRLAWRTASWGRQGRATACETVAPTGDGVRVLYRRDGFVEWYENKPEGLEQGFTIEAPPPGKGPLSIAGSIGGLRPRLRSDGDVDFADREDVPVLAYGKLTVWDALGDEVPSRLAVNGAQLSILIDDDDAKASYPLTVDPIFTLPSWAFEANQAFAHLGAAVATAGDVNGDGRSDVIVGALQFDNGNDLEGRAFVFHAGQFGLPLTPNWIAESNVTDARFGNAVASAGDVNGDGFSDVIIGAFALSNGQTSEGRAYVYHGSSSGLGATPAWTVESNQIGGFFGAAVGTAGDVNGDGFSDVIVGASLYDNAEIDEGRATVYHGSAAGLATSPAWTAETNQGGSQFGISVGTAGDVNGDGFSDVVVGAERYDNPQVDEGRAYAYLGSAGGLSATAVWSADSNQASAFFGGSVGTAGDVNGDGYAEIIVGARTYTNGQGGEGRAYVYQGSGIGPLVVASWIQESNSINAQFGFSVGTAGDVNGDGFADVIVGAPSYNGGSFREGRIYVYEGSGTGLDVVPIDTIESNQAEAQFGHAVGTAGDVNGDGLSDVIVGSHLYDSGQGDEGRAFVYLGMPSGPTLTPVWTGESNQPGGFFATVAGAGDVNGDGYSDVLVGAQGYDNGELDEGRVFAYYGSPTGLPLVPSWFAESNVAQASFGVSLDGAGDVNGDGFSDIIIGALMFPAGAAAGIPGNGKVYAYHGSPSGLGAVPAWTGQIEQEQTVYGRSLGTAGDVNGDGFSDVIVGASLFSNGELGEGRVFVYEGSPPD